MTKAGGQFWCAAPFWIGDLGPWSSLPAGASYSTAVGHPFSASSLNEKLIKLDFSSSNTQINVSGDGWVSNQGSSGDSSPAYTHIRWGRRYLLYLRPTGYAQQTGTTQILGGSGTNFLVRIETDHTWSVIWIPTNTPICTGISMTADTWSALELWYGNRISGVISSTGEVQIVVRKITNLTTTRDTVLLANKMISSIPNGSAELIGDNAARGTAGFALYLLAFIGWDNMDDPYGLIRFDRLKLNGTGGLYNEWTSPSYLNIDDMETGNYDDDTTKDSIASPGSSPGKRQCYQVDSGTYITSSDLVFGIEILARIVVPAATSKGGGSTSFGGITNGTTAIWSINNLGNSSTYFNVEAFSSALTVGGSNWASTDLASVEIALNVTSTDAVTCKNTAMVTIVPYQKSGETLPALPARIPMTRRPYITRQPYPVAHGRI